MKSHIFYGAIATVVVILLVASVSSVLRTDVADEPLLTGEDDELNIDIGAAEDTAFDFVIDVLAAAPGESSAPAAAQRAYAALSSRAQAQMSSDTLMADMAAFVGIQEIPEHGVSVQEFEATGSTTASLVVALNYTNTQAIRSINLVFEAGEWRVDSIDNLGTQPLDDEGDGMLEPDEDISDQSGECYVGGCSGQVCSDDPDVITTCEWREEYACYQAATCERQSDGECGWRETAALEQCLGDASDSAEL